MVQVRFRAPGVPDFDADLSLTATVADAKIAATSGCDIDPDCMKIVFRGRVLQNDSSLESCGVDGSVPLFIARGSVPTAASNATPVAPAVNPHLLRLVVHTPGAGDQIALDGLDPSSFISQLRSSVAQVCACEAGSLHLIHKGRMLRDADTLAAAGLVSGDAVRVARRAMPKETTSATTALPANTGVTPHGVGDAGVPMPMAWNSADTFAQQLELVGRTVFGDTWTPGGQDAQQVAQLTPLMNGQAQVQNQNVRDDYHARFQREARLMEREVRYLIATRARGNEVRPRDPRPVEEDDEEEDAELVAEISRTFAEARARGAPVPNAVSFVDRAVVRRQEAQARQRRLAREAGDIDPDLEDAVADAEQVLAAQARLPRRLGSSSPPS